MLEEEKRLFEEEITLQIAAHQQLQFEKSELEEGLLEVQQLCMHNIQTSKNQKKGIQSLQNQLDILKQDLEIQHSTNEIITHSRDELAI